MKKLSFLLFSLSLLCASCSSESSKSEKQPTKKNQPINRIPSMAAFKMNSDVVVIGSRFEQIKNSWVDALKTEESFLVVEGHYYTNETNRTRARNLGISRADAIKKVLAKSIDVQKIVIDSKLIDKEFKADLEPAYSIQLKSGNAKDLPFKESAEMLTLYFSANDSNVLTDAISTKLSAVASSMKSNGMGANIICHTVGSGNAKADYELGKKAANQVKEYLVSKGVNSGEVRATSMGSSQPAAGVSDNRIQVVFGSN